MTMHAGQVDLTPDAVTALVAAQFPAWASLPVHPVASTGTVNALFRLGDDLVLRFPLLPEGPDDLRREQDHARLLAPHVPSRVPEPLALGEPGPGYPGWWAAYRWIPGRPATPADDVATDLAAFVLALQAMDTEGGAWNGRSRGGPLHTRDEDVRGALAGSTHLTDTAGLATIWADCLAADVHDGPDVWLHADLMPGNLLIHEGRLAAVIDLGAVCLGDPAVDLMPAWNLLPAAARATYRKALGTDDATWRRGRGWALSQAITALPYYVDTNPAMAETARHTLTVLLDDQPLTETR
ncbi:aminoglycoside phosphotransferase family protein [Actinoplanes sp. NPDC051494]|uniref:aminoglycoside phosphotransferase family protein n=1 Tax=Actinoplanes sp. NPDC051494 TaxID=3363907 RepID=UPI0037A4D74E